MRAPRTSAARASATRTTATEATPGAQMDPLFSKYDLIEFFVQSLHELERRTSLATLSPEDYQALLKNVDRLGGWRKLLELTNKEVFEAGLREKVYRRERKKLLKSTNLLRRPLQKRRVG